MRAPIRPLQGTLPAPIEQRLRRFVWKNPAVVVDDEASDEAFRGAMSAVHVGDTIKITGADRHPNADSLVLERLDLSEANILDIGASDGTTSVDFIAKLPSFGSYVIADLYMFLTSTSMGGFTLFFDPDDVCILIVGKRFVAWPSLSAWVRTAYSPIIERARRRTVERSDVLLLNPSARRLMQRDPRVTYAVHDIFTPWRGTRPDLIKVANLLRRFYFSDEQILRALNVILEDLDEGGHFLIVDNGRIRGIGPRAGLYRKHDDRFVPVADAGRPPEIADLIDQAGAPARLDLS